MGRFSNALAAIGGAVGLPIGDRGGAPTPKAAFLDGDYRLPARTYPGGRELGGFGGFAARIGMLRGWQEDVSAAWPAATARAVELVQNNGWISGMVDQACANTIGMGLRLRSMPENEIFGMDEETANAWRKGVEARWELWANNPLECDIEGRRTIAQMQDTAFRHWIATGEIFAEIVWRRRRESKTGTKLRLMSSTRLVNRTDALGGLFAGVRVNKDGMPIAYVTRESMSDPGFLLSFGGEIEVPARDRLNRPKIIHVFVGHPGQYRGITVLVPVLRIAKKFDELSQATLMASIIQTVFAASITSEETTQQTLQSLLTPQEQGQLLATGMSPFDAWFNAQDGWYDGHPVDVGISGRIAHLFPGQEMKFLSPDQPSTNYEGYAAHLLREMARCLGLTYESATGDYSGATYSSVRAAVNEIFGITRARRKHIMVPFLQPIYEAWLEEQIEAGNIPFPGGIDGFLANRGAACRASWPGDPKPVADELKTAKSNEVYHNIGVVSDQMIASDLGAEIEDVYAQRQREKDMRAKYGLPENNYPLAPALNAIDHGDDPLVADAPPALPPPKKGK